MTLPFHPYAEIFNLITGSEFAELVADVRRFGLRERIVMLDGQVLDGRNRYLAAIAAGLLAEDDDPDDRPAFFQRFVPDVDGDPLDYVISRNIHRRHLSVAQRAYAMAESETLRHGGARQGQDANLQLEPEAPKAAETRAELAERAHVSERSIASAAVVRDQGVPELKTAVRQGEVAISAAEEIARLPEDEQRKEIARLPNGSRSIMASRLEPDDSLDFSPTPPWATRALCERVLPQMNFSAASMRACSVDEPACGEGHMAEPLREYFGQVTAHDIHDYGHGPVRDFLTAEIAPADWFITNPPFRDKALDFALKALAHARVGVAIFARLQWLETIGRYEKLFRDNPPTQIAFFCERVNLCMGRWEPDGGTATAYIWLVWIKGRPPRAPYWIPPGQQAALTRADDVERFTAHPVKPRAIVDEPYDAETGEILASDDAQVIAPPVPHEDSLLNQSEPAPPAWSSPLVEEIQDIPAFLRRQKTEAA